ncbi:MAG: DUF6338 family protein [Azospirillaceae bacterium]
MGGDFSQGALFVVAFLLPGLCFLLVFRLLCDVRKLDKIDQTAVAFIISLGSHLAADMLFGTSLLGAAVGDPSADANGGTGSAGTLVVPVSEILVPAALAFVVGAGFSAVYQRDLVYPTLRNWRLTRKTGRLSVWHHVFVENDGSWLIVELDSGVQLLGWAREFSIQGDARELFLGDATVFEPLRGGLWRQVEVPGPGIYIPNMSRINAIRFLDGEPG